MFGDYKRRGYLSKAELMQRKRGRHIANQERKLAAPDMLKQPWSHIGHKSWRKSKPRKTAEEKEQSAILKEVRRAARLVAAQSKAQGKQQKIQERLLNDRGKQAVIQFCLDWLKQDASLFMDKQRAKWRSPSGYQHVAGYPQRRWRKIQSAALWTKQKSCSVFAENHMTRSNFTLDVMVAVIDCILSAWT